MTRQWRVFIGQWDDPDFAQVDVVFDDYSAARVRMDETYARWATDSCRDCLATAADDDEWLRSLPSGAEFVGEVEGDDHLLIRADRDDLTDLWTARQADPVGHAPGRHHRAMMERARAERPDLRL